MTLITKSPWHPGRLTTAGRAAARDQFSRGDTQHTWQGTPAAHPGNRVAGTGEVIRRTVPGESALTKHLVAWAVRTWEGHKTQAQPSLCLCGVPKNLNLSVIDLGSACNPEPALDSFRAEQYGAWAVQTEKPHMLWAGASPVWLRHCKHSPHMPAIFVYSVPPSLQNNWTSEPK